MTEKIVLRDAKGRLLPGSQLGLGRKNPTGKRAVESRQIFYDYWQDKVHDLNDKLHDIIMHGTYAERLEAITLVFNRLWGKPETSVQLSVHQGDVTVGRYTEEQLDAIANILDQQQALPDLSNAIEVHPTSVNLDLPNDDPTISSLQNAIDQVDKV